MNYEKGFTRIGHVLSCTSSFAFFMLFAFICSKGIPPNIGMIGVALLAFVFPILGYALVYIPYMLILFLFVWISEGFKD